MFMEARLPFHLTEIVIAVASASVLLIGLVRAGGAAEPASGANLAAVATPSASYVSGDTALEALNDGHDPKSSQDRSKRSYGNWPKKGTQWVQYEWSQPISTRAISVYWWNDRRGVRDPKACRLLYWSGDEFVPVKSASGLGVEEGKLNTTTFDEVTTLKLKLEIDSSEKYSTGILEWRVYDSGKSPAFPPTVEAGDDRVVMVGGRTHLAGCVKTLYAKDAGKVAWSKAEGPGEVSFADPKAAVTTATFSKPGDYSLRLKAGKSPLAGEATVNVKVESRPPKEPYHPVDTAPYKIDSPLWNHRARALIANWIPHCIEKINDPELKEGGINNFVDAANKLAGKPHGKHRGYVFSNAWIYNTIESICVALMVDPAGDKRIIDAQKKMKATLDDWIPKVLAAQEPDGYIQTFYTLNDKEHWTPNLRHAHEGYVAGYLLEAAVSHYMLTGGEDKRLYDCAKRLADCWDRNIGPPPKKEWYCGHQAMEMGLVRFGRFVSDVEDGDKGRRYIELAKFLLDCRKDGHEYDQSHVPVVQQYEAVGHAVRASYSYAGMADVCMETGDIDYQSAVASLWDNIVNKKYYVTGGLGSGETSEGFGPNYSLRHNAYCEACSSCGEIYFQHKLNMTYHDAKYADLYEETLYNALLGSFDLEGKNFYYQNPLVCGGLRYPWHGCPCCIGNIPRVLLMLPTWTYAKSDDTICVNLFVGSTVTIEGVAGTDVEMAQRTDYPWKGDVSIIVRPREKKKFGIRIRVPNRDVSALYTGTPDCDGIHAAKLNGKSISPEIENGYAAIEREWDPGDEISFKLPMRIQRIKGSDKIEATAGQTALRYGPVVYCVESVDQDMDKTLEADAPLTTEWREDLLDGVTVIKGKWSDGSPLTAIPYYARANRTPEASAGDSSKPPRPRSTVWIKDH
jgi:uncharacterized protein